jgi:hypothetical protein
MRLEGLSQLKSPLTPFGIEPSTEVGVVIVRIILIGMRDRDTDRRDRPKLMTFF